LFCGSSGCVPEAADAGQFITASGGNILHGFLNTAGTWTEMFRVDSSGNGYFAGNLSVKGTLSKGSGSFKIDHPLDPANKYLSHSFVESPDMMNIYNGNVTTDKHGLATIVLPDYFEALNRDFRYQLTVIGEFAQAIVKEEIMNNRFTIKTNKPLVKVSWQVTGIRHDAYANAYRIPTEELKTPQDQGHYLHPELFGASDEEAIGAVLPVPAGGGK
jgi:trimeric autotransporter adhesin